MERIKGFSIPKTGAVAVLAAALFSACGSGSASADVDYRGEMRTLVKEISAYAKARESGFFIVPQNGQELATDTGDAAGKIESDYLAALDGTGREDLFYGYTADDAATPVADTDYMSSLCDVFESNGKAVLGIDYCSTQSKVDASYAANDAKGYIGFAADRRGLDAIPAYPSEPHNKNGDSIADLNSAKNFLYLINGSGYADKAALLAAVADTDYDVVVMDLFQYDAQFSAAEIDALKIKKNGGARIILAYMSIGEAEDYRYYWDASWATAKPFWLKDENPSWAGNYKVEYWNAQWKSILFGSSSSYLDRIVAAHFDGVYLDIIDAFEYFENK